MEGNIATPTASPAPSVEASPSAVPESTPENVVSGREVVAVTPVASETPPSQLTDQQIKDIAGEPPSLEHLSGSNTPASIKGMSLLEQNRMEARLAKAEPANLPKERQRISAEFNNGEILSKGQVRQKYAGEQTQSSFGTSTSSEGEEQEPIPVVIEPPDTKETVKTRIKQKMNELSEDPEFQQAIEKLQAEGGVTDEAEMLRLAIEQTAVYKQQHRASQSTEAPIQPPDTVINVPPTDPRLEQARKDYAELKRDYDAAQAKIVDLEALLAAKNQPVPEAATTTPPVEATPTSTIDQQTVTSEQPDATDKNGDTEGENQTNTPEEQPTLTAEQQALVDRINKYVEKLSNMPVRGTTEISTVLPKIRQLTTELEKELDIMRHPERVQQLEAIIQIMGGKSVERIKEDQATNPPDLNLSIINLLRRFTTPEAKLDFQGDVPTIQANIESYIANEGITLANLEALRGAIGKTEDELNGSPLGEIIKLIAAALGNELWDAASSAVTSSQAA